MFSVNCMLAESQRSQGDKLRIDTIRHLQCSHSNFAPDASMHQVRNKQQDPETLVLECFIMDSLTGNLTTT